MTAQTPPPDSSIEEIYGSLDIVHSKLLQWWEGAVALLPNLVVALLVVMFFGFAARLARTMIKRFLVKMSDNRVIAGLLSNIALWIVVLVGLFIALGVLQLEKTVTSLLAGAGVIGIALAFAFQDLAANLIAGIYLSFQRPFTIGDLIETQDVFGQVEAIDLRTTRLRTLDGQLILTPNKEIFENKLINYSRTGERRVSLAVGVAYDEDLEHVRQVAVDAVSGLEVRRTDKDVDLFYESFGGSSIDFVVRFWIDHRRQSDYRHAMSEAIIAVKKAFDAEGINIPFPIRTLDFGDLEPEAAARALLSGQGKAEADGDSTGGG